MPTEPLEALLYRDLAKVQAQDIIQVGSPLLKELVNYASNAWLRCNTSSSGKENEHLSVFMLYMHVIEMTDGIEVLVSQSCAVPAIPLVRSTFEASLSMQYIMENEADYTRRSLAWTADYVHDRLKSYELLDETQPRGRWFKKKFPGKQLAPQGEVRKAIARLENMLTGPEFAATEAEIRRYKAKHQRRPKWHALFDGPPGLEDLARHLQQEHYYEAMYRYWSRISHAGDLSRFIGRSADGVSGIKPLRNPESLPNVTTQAAVNILMTTRIMLAKFRPGEDLTQWYLRDVQPRYLAILNH